MCVSVCVCACVCARVRVCARVCARARVCMDSTGRAVNHVHCEVTSATVTACLSCRPRHSCVALLSGFPRARAEGCVFGVTSTTWLLATKYLIVSIPAQVGQHSFTDAILQQIIKSQQRDRTAFQTITGMLEHGSSHCFIMGRKVTWGPLN